MINILKRFNPALLVAVIITASVTIISAYNLIFAWNGELQIVNQTCDIASAHLVVNPDEQVVSATINGQERRDLDLNWNNDGIAEFDARVEWDTGEVWSSDHRIVERSPDCDPIPQPPDIGHPRTCSDFGKTTVYAEPDWIELLMRTDPPVSREFNRPQNSDFAVVNAGWQWFEGNPGPVQTNEVHKLETDIGQLQVPDYGDNNTEGLTFWSGYLTGNLTDNLNATVSFAGDDSSQGSHFSHVIVEWCEAKTEPSPTPTPTGTPTPTSTITPTPTVTPTPTPHDHDDDDDEPHCSGLSASPSSGSSPLTVHFTGSGFDPNGDILEYEFDFGDASGFQPQIWKTEDSEAAHRYENAGSYIATLRVKDQGGRWRDGGDDCRIEIIVDGVPQVLSASTAKGLPATGTGLNIAVGILLTGTIGRFLYKRFRLV